MTKDELSLLIYLETCEVDGNGKVDMAKINDDDFEIMLKWNESG